MATIDNRLPALMLMLGGAWAAGACAGTQKVGDAAPSAATIEDYSPLAIGASWTYDMNYPGQSGEMVVTIKALEDGFFVDDRNGAFRHTQDGLRDRSRYLIRGPLIAGNTWKTVVSASAVEHAKIASVGQPCESVAGDFSDCLVVEGSIRRDRDVTLHIRWTWARGVGLAKVETEVDIAGKGRIPQTKQSLRRYALASAAALGTRDGQSGSIAGSEQAPGAWER